MMKLIFSMILAFVVVVTAMPTSHPSKDSTVSSNITNTDVVKHALYGYVCDSENPPLDGQDQISCYNEIHDRGVDGETCSVHQLCQKSCVKVMSTLCQTTNQSFKLNCVELAEAVREVINRCQLRGGSAGVPTKSGWTQDRQDLIVAHLKSSWLARRSVVDSVHRFGRRYLFYPVARAAKWLARRELVEQVNTAPFTHEPVPEYIRFYVEKGGNVIWYKNMDELISRQLVEPVTVSSPHIDIKPAVAPAISQSLTDVKLLDEDAELARRAGLLRRTPYKIVCNSEDVIEGDQSYCQAWFRTFGGSNDHCGATALCQYGGVKVSGTLWETTDKSYETKCSYVSNAIEEVWKTCGKRGGSAAAHDGSTISNLVVHVNNHWLGQVAKSASPALNLMDATAFKNTTEVKLFQRQNESTEYVVEFEDTTVTHPRSVANAAVLAKRGPYMLRCNDERIMHTDYNLCQGKMHLWGVSNSPTSAGNGKLCELNTIKVSGTLWETKNQNLKVNMNWAATAVKDIWTECGYSGGSGAARDPGGSSYSNVMIHLTNDWL